ncbi:MAG: hypothetical protein RBS80_13220 [Thermoguttaceae bacterium]|jgi:hypothetical protein|nr:hypothetical protein [Thermoguttaceae bacterium]
MPATIDERTVRQPGKAEFQAWWRYAITAIPDSGMAEDDPRATPDEISPERRQLADAGVLHLSPIVSQLVELWNEPEEEDEYGRLRPTQGAFDRSVGLLVDAAIEAHYEQRAIPSGCVSIDSEGGVRIEWVRPAASVHLVVPASKDNEAYVYHEAGDDYATEDVTPEGLAYWLRLIK